MLVDRIGVEEVVLHLADDGAKVRQVKPEDVELVHPPEFMQHAARLFEQSRTKHAGFRVVAEVVVDQRPRARHSARIVRAVMPFSSECCCMTGRLRRWAGFC